MTRVLVIDDEAPIRLLCRVNLEAEGMSVLEAGDGPSGLATASAEQPDVILLDVMMPGLDGWGVAEALLEDEQTVGIPIIFLTARAEFRDRARGLDIGGVDYITKPFNPRRAGAARPSPARAAGARRARRAPAREAHRAPLLDGRDLAAGEVRGDDDRAAVAEEAAAQGADSDPVPAGAEKVRAVTGTRHPGIDDAASGRQATGSPREVLAEGRPARAVEREPLG